MRKKISIAEAVNTLRAEGFTITRDTVVPMVPPIEPIESTPVRRVGVHATTITLYATHTIGSGGEFVVDATGKRTLINNGITAYGPGKVTVPTRLVEQLLYADQQARLADQRLLDRTERSYLIMQRVSGTGAVAHVGQQVQNSLLNGNILNSVGDNVVRLY